MVEHTIIGRGHGDLVLVANSQKYRTKKMESQKRSWTDAAYRITMNLGIKSVKSSFAILGIVFEFSLQLLFAFFPPIGVVFISCVFARSRGKALTKVYTDKKYILQEHSDLKEEFTWLQVLRFGFVAKFLTLIPVIRPFAHVLNATAAGVWASKSERRIRQRVRREQRIQARKIIQYQKHVADNARIATDLLLRLKGVPSS